MYKIIFKSLELLIEKVEDQLDKAQENFDSLIDELPVSADYDKEFIRRRIHHVFEFFSEFTLDQNDGRTRNFWHVTAISDFDQRFIALPMLKSMKQFAQSILLQPTDNKKDYLYRYHYYHIIFECLDIVSKMLLCKQHATDFYGYREPINLATLQHKEKIDMLLDETYFSYMQHASEISHNIEELKQEDLLNNQ